MKTLFLTADAPDTVSVAAEIIRSGGLVAIPTETVYGLGANGLNEDAVRRIFEAKGRPQDNPLILHIAEAEQMELFCEDVPPVAYELAKTFWPGPLTLVLKCKSIVPKRTTAGLDTVAIRCPDHAVTRAIIAASGVPVAAPSGNTSGRPSPTKASHMVEDMDGKIEAIVDGGSCGIGVESTILDLTVTPPRLLRPGGMPVEKLAEIVGEIAVDDAVIRPMKEGEKPRAPGMKYRHYAPKAPVTVLTGSGAATAAYIAAEVQPGDGVICFAEFSHLFSDCEIQLIGEEGDDLAHAQRVFDALRAFDGTEVPRIFAQCPPEQGLGLAVANRLKKAAGFHVIAL